MTECPDAVHSGAESDTDVIVGHWTCGNQRFTFPVNYYIHASGGLGIFHWPCWLVESQWRFTGFSLFVALDFRNTCSSDFPVSGCMPATYVVVGFILRLYRG
jgi:hypothetical protein